MKEADLTELTVVKINKSENTIFFNNGIKLFSEHEQDCCENHWLSLRDLSLDDFEGLKFDLSNDNFFTRIKDYGIALNPVYGWPVRIPGYGSNNGYYSSDLTLVIADENNTIKTYDISECQDWNAE